MRHLLFDLNGWQQAKKYSFLVGVDLIEVLVSSSKPSDHSTFRHQGNVIDTDHDRETDNMKFQTSDNLSSKKGPLGQTDETLGDEISGDKVVIPSLEFLEFMAEVERESPPFSPELFDQQNLIDDSTITDVTFFNLLFHFQCQSNVPLIERLQAACLQAKRFPIVHRRVFDPSLFTLCNSSV